jgi:hypothetical protein
VVCDRQLSATTFDVLGKEEARKSATAYIFITLCTRLKSNSDNSQTKKQNF